MTNDACGGEMTRKLMTKNDVDDILIIILPYHVDVSSLPVKENIIGPTVDNRAEREKRTVLSMAFSQTFLTFCSVYFI